MSATIDLNRTQASRYGQTQQSSAQATSLSRVVTPAAMPALIPASSALTSHYIDGQTQQYLRISPTAGLEDFDNSLLAVETIDTPVAAQLLLAAKQLRTQCFASSFGVVFNDDLDSDDYDEACLHIVLQQAGQVIATARVLDSQRAALLGHFYSENEFYLTPLLKPYPYEILEVGRTCIHPEYRNGKVLRLLWQAISQVARYLKVNAFMGCCSIPIGAGNINGWLQTLAQVPKVNIRPKYRLPPTILSSAPTIPPLLNTYLKMGASISEQACFDVDFHCADVLVWLPFEQVHPRYQHLLGGM
jgi:putative hemolysin